MFGSRNAIVLAAVLFVVAAAFVTGAIGFRRSGAQIDRVTGTEETLAEYLQREASQLRGSLPLRTDEVTLWQDVQASGRQMTFIYRLEFEIPADERDDFADTIRPQVNQTVCGDLQVRSILDRGATVIFSYIDAADTEAASISLASRDCPSP